MSMIALTPFTIFTRYKFRPTPPFAVRFIFVFLAFRSGCVLIETLYRNYRRREIQIRHGKLRGTLVDFECGMCCDCNSMAREFCSSSLMMANVSVAVIGGASKSLRHVRRERQVLLLSDCSAYNHITFLLLGGMTLHLMARFLSLLFFFYLPLFSHAKQKYRTHWWRRWSVTQILPLY